MRLITYLFLAMYWIACILLYPQLPDRVAIHFNARGEADAWSDNPFFAWFGIPAIATVTVLLLIGIGKLSAKTPHMWNVPEKKRFLALTPEARAPIIEELSGVMDFASLYTIAVCMVVQLGIYENAARDASHLPAVFHIVVWGGMAVLLLWAVRLNRRIKRMILTASGIDPDAA